MTLRLAVLDDYQRAAGPATDWSVLDGRAEVDFFHDHTEGTRRPSAACSRSTR